MRVHTPLCILLVWIVRFLLKPRLLYDAASIEPIVPKGLGLSYQNPVIELTISSLLNISCLQKKLREDPRLIKPLLYIRMGYEQKGKT